jgi:thioredoxin reductase
MVDSWDCVVVGGGAAGLSAAASVVQSLLVDEYGLIGPEWRTRVSA